MNLIVGGDGVIGKSLTRYWIEKSISFHASTRHKDLVSRDRPFVDLEDELTFGLLSKYESAVFCAAITDMATCERNTVETRAINVYGTIELIKKLSSINTYILFLSTNQVFDGKYPNRKPDASRSPINEYGRQKAEVERFIGSISNAGVLRLTKVIHLNLELLIKWKQTISNGKVIHAFDDMTLSPVDIDSVVKKINKLVHEQGSGIFQLSGEKDISYYDFARRFVEENGYSPELVKKDTWKGKLDFTPPKYTSLVNI